MQRDKLAQGKNRVVSVITRNSGNRTQFHYKFLLQRNINNEPITIYNNGNPVLKVHVRRQSAGKRYFQSIRD